MNKRNLLKRVVSLLFALSLVFSMLPTAVFPAAVEAASNGGLKDGLNIELNGAAFEVSWAAVPGAASYQIQRSGARLGTTYTTLATVGAAVLSYTDATPNANKYENYYKIVAMSGENGTGTVVNTEIISLEGKIFGSNVLIYDSKYQTAASAVEEMNYIHDNYMFSSTTGQFSERRYAMFFKPGNYIYNTFTKVGYYTSVYGLGKLPTEVQLGGIKCPAPLSADNNTCTFWRSIENVQVHPHTGSASGNLNGFQWNVAQAAPARRIDSIGEAFFGNNWDGWSSPGYWADSVFHKSFGYWSAQQFYTRNNEFKSATMNKTTMNTFLQGCTGIVPANDWNANATITNVPMEIIREKPFV